LWETNPESPNILKQVWFAGLHASVTGGYQPPAFGDISLTWMISEVSTLTDLEFDRDFLVSRLRKSVPLNAVTWGAVSPPPYPIMADQLAYSFGPKLKRTPGRYPPPPKDNVRNEFYHHSVKERIEGTRDRYPAGQAVVNTLPMLPYTNMERELAIESGLATVDHIQALWEV
jgi:hypothetical protein